MVVLVGSAHADDETATHLAERYGREEALPAPLLELDPVLRPTLEGLGTKESRHTARYDVLGTRITVEGVERSNDLDVVSRGWRSGVKVQRDLGFAVLTAGLTIENVQSTAVLLTDEGERRFGSRTYVDMGVALTRTFKLSRWNTAWISLSLGRRRWLGDGKPPQGEDDATQLMLSIGTTFK